MYRWIAGITAALLISGCQTSSQAYQMSQKGMGAFSCDEINKAFSAYEMDRQSAQALAVLAPLIYADAGNVTQNVSTTSEGYYQQAKASANVALVVQGCQPMP